MLTMILQMTGATVLYIAATVLLWNVWNKRSEHTLLQKMAIGLFYGVCSIISSHIGINYGDMVLNVRDLGPLAAGLLFDPLAGILSGLIGGIERYIIGEFFNIGHFTRVACSVSTIFAGFLSAGLYKWIYKGQRPSAINCLFVGAEMEVFHMYAVFITNRDSMKYASAVVEVCALPMIAFTGIGLMACSLIIARISGMKWKTYLTIQKKDIPIDHRFQLWLLVVVIALLGTSLTVHYNLQTRIANEAAETELRGQQWQPGQDFETDHDVQKLEEELESLTIRTDCYFMMMDAEQNHQFTYLNQNFEDPELAAMVVDFSGEDRDLFWARIRFVNDDDSEYLCASRQVDGSYYLLVAMPDSTIYKNRRSQMMETLFLEILIFTALYLLVGVLVTRLVVQNLEWVNKSLSRITAGDLNEVVAVKESTEFTKLSDDINKTVLSLRNLIDEAEKRMEEELELAAQIQDSALPKNFRLPSGNIKIYATMNPAKQVGGDFYDFFYVDVDRLAFVIADVSGKGIPAAMFMMRAKTAIKNFARNGLSPAKILEHVNNALCEDNDTHMFVTVWIGILDLRTGEMRCANGGHEYPVLMRAGHDYTVLTDTHGFVLGGFEDITMEEYEIRLNPGDRMFVYTDGIPEAKNTENKQYGLERLTECLNKLKDGEQEQILGGMLESIREFARGAEQFDDITMLGFTFAPSGDKE